METFAGRLREKTDSKHRHLPTVVSETVYWVVHAGSLNTLTQTALAFLGTWAVTTILPVHTDQKEGVTIWTIATILGSLTPQDHLSPELPVLTKLGDFTHLLNHLEMQRESHLAAYSPACHREFLNTKKICIYYKTLAP